MEEREILAEMDENEKRLLNDNLVSHTQLTLNQDDCTPREQWMQEHKTQLLNLAQNHGEHVKGILQHNLQLEEQRAEIVRRLNELSEKSKNFSQVEKMLAELKAQEYKNELLLETMRQQLEMLQLDTIQNKARSRQSSLPSRNSKKKETLHQPQTFVPFYGGGSLPSEISALRLSYLQNGGNDQLILVQLHDLLAEALQVERREKLPRTHRKERAHRGHDTLRRNLDSELITAEIENQRLEEEILKLRVKRQRNHRPQKALKTSTGHRLILTGGGKDQALISWKDDNQKMRALKTEIDLLKQDMEIQRLQRHLRSSKTQVLAAAPVPTPPLVPARATSENVLIWPADGSHWINLKSIINELIVRGHSVTVAVSSAALYIDYSEPSPVKFEVFQVPFTSDKYRDFMHAILEFWIYEKPQISHWEAYRRFSAIMERGIKLAKDICDGVIKNEKHLQKLRDSKFDVVLSDPRAFLWGSPGSEAGNSLHLLAEILPGIYSGETLRTDPSPSLLCTGDPLRVYR
ncbi:uncharacterized protein LOC129693775 [Leucoraja erinacea]|uniref:uncharacterized protein LOC129693775 n=1 Tax=Leucoraja erinaceus TaxID=7782 RepID=UPI00245522C2|nr:uncharacterized protein LOC129693775 [Leucoraja erinacea]